MVRGARRVSAEKDYYAVLGVPPDASIAVIKKAYYRLARKYHPDVNGGSERAAEYFKLVNEAYAVLSDPSKRREYDFLRRYGCVFSSGARAAGGARAGRRGSGGRPAADSFAMEDLEREFAELKERLRRAFDEGLTGWYRSSTTGGGSSSGPAERRGEGGGADRARGEDVSLLVFVSRSTAERGSRVRVDYERFVPCPSCGGRSAGPCPECGGSGVRMRSMGMFSLRRVCSVCFGSGVASGECSACKGRGLVRRRCILDVKLPRGVEDGAVVRCRGQGDHVLGGGPGDLLLRVCILDDADEEGGGPGGDDEDASLPEVVVEPMLALKGGVTRMEWNGRDIRVEVPAGCRDGTKVATDAGEVVVRVAGGDELMREASELMEALELLSPVSGGNGVDE